MIAVLLRRRAAVRDKCAARTSAERVHEHDVRHRWLRGSDGNRRRGHANGLHELARGAAANTEDVNLIHRPASDNTLARGSLRENNEQ
jgi:hypothetical protein